MKKTVALLALLPWINAFAALGGAEQAAAPRPGPSTASAQIAAAGEDLIGLLPRSTIGVLVLDIGSLLEVDAIAKAIEDPEFKKLYDDFVKASGIDPKRDVSYVGWGIPASALAGLLSTPASLVPFKDFAIVVGLTSKKARLQDLFKATTSEASEEKYNGVTIYSHLADEGKSTPPGVPAEAWKMMSFRFAFLDDSHLVLGDDPGVKGVIDVTRIKAESLAKNSGLIALLSEVDKLGFVWGGVSIPPELIKKGVETDPLFKAFEAVNGLTVALDDKAPGSIAVDISFFGGTKEQNSSLTSVLTGLKAMGTMGAALEPAMEVLMNGVAITSGGDRTRLSITLSRDSWEAFSRLAQSQAGGPSPNPPGAGEEWQALADEADALYRKGDPERAMELGRTALEAAEKNAGPDHPDVAVSLNLLALLLQAQGQYAEAEPLYKRALAIYEKAHGPDNPDLATCLDNIASLYDAMGKYSEAESLCKRSLAIREKALGPDHPDVAMSLDGLAQVYLDQDRYAEAEPLLERSLAIAEKTLGLDHPIVATVLNDLGLLRLYQGRIADAQPLFLRSVDIYEEALGKDHPSVARSLNTLADLCRVQGRSTQAGSLYERSLAITEKTLGPDHPLAAESLRGLALLHGDQGQFELAEPLLERSLAISEKALGQDHPYVAALLEMMAELYRATDREDEAEELESRAARIRAIKR